MGQIKECQWHVEGKYKLEHFVSSQCAIFPLLVTSCWHVRSWISCLVLLKNEDKQKTIAWTWTPNSGICYSCGKNIKTHTRMRKTREIFNVSKPCLKSFSSWRIITNLVDNYSHLRFSTKMEQFDSQINHFLVLLQRWNNLSDSQVQVAAAFSILVRLTKGYQEKLTWKLNENFYALFIVVYTFAADFYKVN